MKFINYLNNLFQIIWYVLLSEVIIRNNLYYYLSTKKYKTNIKVYVIFIQFFKMQIFIVLFKNKIDELINKL